MKIKIITKSIGNLGILFFSVFLFTTAVFSQTETKPQNDIPKPKAIYEYIEPQNIFNFMLALKEAGNRGFKLHKMTPLPGSAAETSKGAAKGTVLAGIVRFDGESRFDYNFFFAEGEDNPEQTLNNLSKSGWRFRDVISVYGSGDEDSLLIEDIFANKIRKFPTMGNIYLLERVADSKKAAPVYKLLKAGVGTGKNPTAKMQGLLEQAVTEGFAPVGSYFTFDVKSLFSVDSFSGVIIEKNDEAKKPEYKFVRSARSDGLRKEIATFSKQGFRIGTLNFNSAILVRDVGNTTPVDYVWLETGDKNYVNELTATLAKNLSYFSSGVDQIGSGDYIRNLLIFENNPAAQTSVSEYQFLKMIPKIPKQFKKNPQDYLKTLEKPNVVFQRLLDEGYSVRDLYYSDNEGLIALFERRKNK